MYLIFNIRRNRYNRNGISSYVLYPFSIMDFFDGVFQVFYNSVRHGFGIDLCGGRNLYFFTAPLYYPLSPLYHQVSQL